MVHNVYTVAFNGIEAIEVDVQIHISPGIPNFIIVGLADKTIAESKERVRTAISAIGISLPPKKIVINLSPADLVKEGSHFDLAIACAILSSYEILPSNEINSYIILGELGLDGTILPVNGVLPASICANSLEKGVICPASNGQEAAWSGNKDIIAPTHLLNLVNHFKGTQVLAPPTTEILHQDKANTYPDLADVKGQRIPKRAIEIAAIGGHNLLMLGPPGSGKSMMAQCLPGILPSITHQEILECSIVASVAGLIRNGNLIKQRPFRAPHHSCSMAAMVGGGIGKKVKPGEVSLAHNGILFLDELAEFSSSVLESLRQPVETGEIFISRSGCHVRYPANFQLIAAMNPCKCGYVSEPSKACSRAPNCSKDYLMKISGPLMDRFDMQIEVPFFFNSFSNQEQEEKSSNILLRIKKAQEFQMARCKEDNITRNKDLNGELLLKYAMPKDDDAQNLLEKAMEKFKLSMRSYSKILRLARSIADLEQIDEVKKHHIAEALSYRYTDKLMSYDRAVNMNYKKTKL